MDNTQLVTTNHAINALSISKGNEVNEVLVQLMKLHPKAREIGEQSMMIAAQLAVLSGANPLPKAGELWVWKDWRGNVIIDFGIAFYRRMARQVDILCWSFNSNGSSRPRAMTDKERQEEGVTNGDLGGICRGYRMSEAKELKGLGFSTSDIILSCSQVGTAIVKKSEMFAQKDYKKNDRVYRKQGEPLDAPTGRTWQWVANKRAEKDLIKALALIHPNCLTLLDNANNSVQFVSNDDEIIEGEVEQVGQGNHGTVEDINELLFGGDSQKEKAVVEAGPESGPANEYEQMAYDGQFTNALIGADIFKNNGEIHKALIGTGFNNGLGDMPTDKQEESCKMRLEVFRRWAEA